MKLTQCPLCESKNIRTIVRPFVFERNGRMVSVPSVSRQKCVSCGEEYFDHEANVKIDKFRCVIPSRPVAA